MSNPMEGNMNKVAPTKVVQTERVVQAVAKIDEIVAKHEKKAKRFEVTPGMRREAEIKALQDGNID